MLSKNAGEVVAEVRLLRTQHSQRSFLIVEGVDDVRFWKHRLDTECFVINATCKSVGMEAIYRLNGKQFLGHVGIFDPDFDHFQVQSNINANLIFWDAHSIETVMFESEAFDRVFSEKLGSAVLPQEVDGRIGLRNQIRSAAAQIGRFRALHQFAGAGGEKGAFSPSNFVTFMRGVVLDIGALHEAAVRLGAIPSKVQAQAHVNALPDVDDRHYARGHDLTSIFGICISEFGPSCGKAHVEEAFRLAFHRDDLMKENVYAELRAWEAIRAPYRVLN